MGGSPRPMEPMGPHRPRALKYTPTGGSSRPIGQGPSAKAHGAHGAPYGHVFLDLVFLAQSRPSWGVNPSTPWPPGGFRPNLCSTKIASRASQGRSGHPVPVYTKLQFYKIFNFLNFAFSKVWPYQNTYFFTHISNPASIRAQNPPRTRLYPKYFFIIFVQFVLFFNFDPWGPIWAHGPHMGP